LSDLKDAEIATLQTRNNQLAAGKNDLTERNEALQGFLVGCWSNPRRFGGTLLVGGETSGVAAGMARYVSMLSSP